MNKIKTALISVSDKTNLKNILKQLRSNNIKIISSGGTFREIKKLRFKCIDVSNFTGNEEILDGRVKTLHSKIHAGILNKRKNKNHLKEMKKNNFENIDLVIVNFYPFEKTLEKTLNHKLILENIDIGGPSLVRAAAKNYEDVTVIVSPDNYDDLINELKNNKGSTSLEFRKKMSRKAFTETAYYDTTIANYFNKFSNIDFPQKKIFHGELIEQLRYGENPHQKGAIYSTNKSFGLEQIHGKKLSYNNYNDIFAALSISKSFPSNLGSVIIKHANPCGVSIKKTKLHSYKSAFNCDPLSAFGGVVSCNFQITKDVALELNKNFLEIIIANGFDSKALKILKSKKNLRLINAKNFSFNENFRYFTNNNTILFQSEDRNTFSKKDFKIVSRKKPNKKQFENMIFAFNVCRFVKSNAIVIASDHSTLGIGSGQPSRLDSCNIAINKMAKLKSNHEDIVAASDAFFPFVDGIEKLVQSGVSAIVQPAGSIRDKEIIKFANQTNTILVFSKTRHFRH